MLQTNNFEIQKLIIAATIEPRTPTIQPSGKSNAKPPAIKTSSEGIGIARALYRNPEVLILDEATSSLDGITETAIMDAIHNLAHKKTIVIIAHRLTTLKECDVIYVMEKGGVVESGTYDELMVGCDSFREMSKNIEKM